MFKSCRPDFVALGDKRKQESSGTVEQVKENNDKKLERDRRFASGGHLFT